jgi:hypothetical protein
MRVPMRGMRECFHGLRRRLRHVGRIASRVVGKGILKGYLFWNNALNGGVVAASIPRE